MQWCVSMMDHEGLFTAVPNIVLSSLCDLRASPCACLVLLNLYRRSNVDGQCWPSLDKIAADTQFSKQAVITALKWLQDCGFVDKRARQNEVGGTTSNVYQVLAMGHLAVKPALPPQSSELYPPQSSQLYPKNNQIEEYTMKKDVPVPGRPDTPPEHETAWTEFRSLYPKRLGSLNTPKGKQIYLRLLKEGTKPEVIEEALRKEIGAWRGGGTIGTAYIPQIPSWLNKQPWNDHSGVLHGSPTSDTGAQSKTPVRSPERPKEDWRG